MKKIPCIFLASCCFLVIVSVFSVLTPSYAHFFGKTITVGDYQVVFQPFPAVPQAGNSSTLNFSILQNNSDVYGIFASAIITERETGTEVDRIPYKFYEFSDITMPYVFKNNTDYIVTLEVRINADPEFGEKPMTASFDITVGTTDQMSLDSVLVYYVLPPSAVIAAIMIYLDYRKKNKK